MHRPLTGLCLFYISGIFLGWCLVTNPAHLHLLSFLLILLSLTTLTFFLMKKLTISNLLIHISFLLLGITIYAWKAQPVYSHHIINFLQDEEKKQVVLVGTIIQEPEIRIESSQTKKYNKLIQDARTLFILKAEEIKEQEKWEKTTGLVQVTVKGKNTLNHYGERIKICGALLKKPPLPENPGEFNYRRYLTRKGIYAITYIQNLKQIESQGTGKINLFVRAALAIKEKIREIITATSQSHHDILLAGILLGERGNVSQDFQKIFTRTGTVHILAISGLHVGLVTVIFSFLFRLLSFPRKMRTVLTIFLIITYALMTGARPPVIRASIIAITVLSGILLNRESNLLNSLALSALIILFVNPLELFSAGFQLSFAAVLGIIFISPALYKPKAPDDLLPRSVWKDYLFKSLSVILAVQIAVIPLIAYYYYLFSPVAIIANLIIVPILSLVIALGFTTCLSGLIFLPLAKLFGATNGIIITGMVKLVDLFAHLPGAYLYIGKPRILTIIGYYFLIGIIIYAKNNPFSAATPLRRTRWSHTEK